jgi:hypothetical protein
MPSEPEPSGLVQSLDRAIEESRRIRERSAELLKKAEWPLAEETAKKEEETLVPVAELT